MGMGMIEGGLKLQFPFPDSIYGGVHIPRRRRSSSSVSADISMFEAAAILIAMANGGFCKTEEIELRKNRKRKKKSLTTQTKQRKKRRKEIELPNNNPPEMPAAMRDRIVEMGGYEIELVIQKQLQDTDLNKNHGRLSLPAKKVRIQFTTEEEERKLSSNNKKKKEGLEVMMIDDVLRETSICLKKWKIGSDEVYCFITNWNSFVQQTLLKTGDCIQLWSFRKHFFHPQTSTISPHRLCFAMVKLDIS